MEFYEVVRNRRAVRKYKPDMVQRVIYKILDAANWAPSGMNTQSWEFLVVAETSLKLWAKLRPGV